jgi:hypothetical protein
MRPQRECIEGVSTATATQKQRLPAAPTFLWEGTRMYSPLSKLVMKLRAALSR